MQMTVKKVGVMSLAKVFGAVYGLLGLIIGAIFTLVALAGGLSSAGSDAGGFGAMMFGGVAAIILVPLFYGVLGFIGGLLTAAIFNVVAGFTGGLEMEVEGLYDTTDEVFR